MLNTDKTLKKLFNQLARLHASIFYLENLIEELDTTIDQHDVEVSLKILKKIRDEKQAELIKLVSGN